MKRVTETGSHIVALAMGVLVIGVIAFAGYAVMQRQNDTAPTTNTNAAAKTGSDTELTTAADDLDTSTTQLDSELDDSSLDADLNDML